MRNFNCYLYRFLRPEGLLQPCIEFLDFGGSFGNEAAPFFARPTFFVEYQRDGLAIH